MRILATFITFASDPDVIELVHAWDEYCIDENERGYHDSKAEALATYADNIGSQATVEIVVPEQPIRDALNPMVQVAGRVEVSDR